VQLSPILGIFFETGLSYLPVSSGLKPEEIVTCLSLDRIRIEMADLDRATAEYTELPPHLFDSLVSDSFIKSFARSPSVPVLNLKGEKIGIWNEAEILRALATLKEREKTLVKEEEKSETAHDRSDYWLAKLLLSGIPYPMFARSRNGEALFYNTYFEKEILSLIFFKNSIKTFEAFLSHLLKDIQARAALRGPLPNILKTDIKQLNKTVRIINLEHEGSLIGYLFIFETEEQSSGDIANLIESGISLDDAIEKIEKGIIARALKENGNNISHTALALNIKRTTLQNKMKRYKMKLEIKEPVKRKKSSKKKEYKKEIKRTGLSKKPGRK